MSDIPVNDVVNIASTMIKDEMNRKLKMYIFIYSASAVGIIVLIIIIVKYYNKWRASKNKMVAKMSNK